MLSIIWRTQSSSSSPTAARQVSSVKIFSMHRMRNLRSMFILNMSGPSWLPCGGGGWPLVKLYSHIMIK